MKTQNIAGTTTLLVEQSASIVKADGCVIDIGVITSPYNDKVRNALWKKRKEREIRNLIAEHDRRHPQATNGGQ